MILFLTGSPCRKGEDHFTSDNGFLDEVRKAIADVLVDNDLPAILLVSAAPDDENYNRDVFASMRQCLDRSGIGYRSIVMLERKNADRARELVGGSELVFLCGGHVPTQNRFFHQIGLREILQHFDGVLIGCSAGSMNCAEDVYSHPEFQGEVTDPAYRRHLKGLGLTDINLVPHMEDIWNTVLDGRSLVHDVVLNDSEARRFYLIPDGVYVISRDGRTELRGEAYLIENRNIKQISAEGGTFTFMNAVFISPHFPQTYSHFCAMLRQNGVRVFGIGDTNYSNLSAELRASLDEYYMVNNLEDYDQVYRAVAYFAFKHGRIDWIESNNEYWLEQDARLRTDFNVTTGLKTDRIEDIKEKSSMKKFYKAGGIPTARQIKGSEGLEAVLGFAQTTGYPIIAKPDNGVGAAGTCKMESEDDVRAYFESYPDDAQKCVVEEFITGFLVSYDAVVDSNCEPIFESMSCFPDPVMNIVKENLDTFYWVEKEIDPKLRETGRKPVKAFGVGSRFVHFEFFRLEKARKGLGKKGDYVGLEVNMRPAGGYTPDMMDYAHSTDVYKIWADMVAFNECRTGQGEQYFCAYAGRRDNKTYVHSHDEIIEKYGPSLAKVDRMPKALASALSDMAYMAKLDTREQMQEFFAFVGATK